MEARVLIVDDELELALSVSKFLTGKGYSVDIAGSLDEARAQLKSGSPDLLVVDLHLGRDDGLDVLRESQAQGLDAPAIVVSAYGTFDNSVQSMRLGAVDFLRKPFALAELESRISLALEESRQRSELDYLRHGPQQSGESLAMLGTAGRFGELLEEVSHIAESVSGLPHAERPPVLITGETGSGKNVLARYLHKTAGGKTKPFLELNCTSIQPTLFEAELFGHERGAFTGAAQARKGLFETAKGGAIVLDEVGHVPLELQAKLLTAIEEKTIRRVGSSDNRQMDVWVIAATNAELEGLVAQGLFRSDLFYRLAAFHLRIPPLRERKDDIVLLAEHFLAASARKYRRPAERLSDEAQERLRSHAWPGNLRELRNMMERTVVRSQSTEIGADDLRGLEAGRLEGATPLASPEAGSSNASQPERYVLPEQGVAMDDVERDLLRQALERAKGNVSAAARLLNMTREKFRSRLKRLGAADA